MEREQAYDLKEGDRVVLVGVSSTSPGFQAMRPEVGSVGTITSDGGPDGDGDLHVVWDEAAFNDQTNPKDPYVYVHHYAIERWTPTLDTIDDVEAFLAS